MPVEHQRLATSGAAPRAERVRAAVLDLLPLHLEAELLVERDHQLRHPLLVAGDAVDVDHRARGLDQALAVETASAVTPGRPFRADRPSARARRRRAAAPRTMLRSRPRR